MVTLSEGFILYLSHLRRLRRRETTISNYRYSLKKFLERYGHLDTKDISLDMVHAHQDFLLSQDYAPRVYQHYVIDLRAFIKYLNLEELSNVKLHRIEIPSAEKTMMSVLTEGELDAFLLYYLNKARTLKGIRDFTFYYTLYSTGCRISEALSLNRDCFVEGVIQIRGKGGRIRKIYFSPECQTVLYFYMKCRTDDFPPLFINISNNGSHYKEDKRLSTTYIRKNMKVALKALGITRKITPHTFRHTFATFLWGNGKGLDIKKIMEILGHSTIATTDNYIHQLGANFREEFLEYHHVPLFGKKEVGG